MLLLHYHEWYHFPRNFINALAYITFKSKLGTFLLYGALFNNSCLYCILYVLRKPMAYIIPFPFDHIFYCFSHYALAVVPLIYAFWFSCPCVISSFWMWAETVSWYIFNRIHKGFVMLLFWLCYVVSSSIWVAGSFQIDTFSLVNIKEVHDIEEVHWGSSCCEAQSWE